MLKNAAEVFCWYVFGGLIMGLCWSFIGLMLYLFIISIPFGKTCLQIAFFNFFPFNKEVMDKNEFLGRESFAADCWSLSGNQLWVMVAGWWLALTHLVFAIVNFLTIFGISAGQRHLQLACVSISPIGKVVTSKQSAINARKNNALQRMQKLRDELSD